MHTGAHTHTHKHTYTHAHIDSHMHTCTCALHRQCMMGFANFLAMLATLPHLSKPEIAVILIKDRINFSYKPGGCR